MTGKKSDYNMLYVDEEIGVGRWTSYYGRFSLVGSLMVIEECNKRWINDKAEEPVPWFCSLTGE